MNIILLVIVNFNSKLDEKWKKKTQTDPNEIQNWCWLNESKFEVTYTIFFSTQLSIVLFL